MPKGNSYVERFHRSSKQEEVWLNEYQNFDQAKRIAGWFDISQKRPAGHWRLHDFALTGQSFSGTMVWSPLQKVATRWRPPVGRVTSMTGP